MAWYVRENVKSYQIKFLFSYIPVVFHIAWHLYLWEITLEQIDKHNHTSDFWLIVSTICLWIFIFVWEYLLHKKYHCEHNHEEVHKQCKEN